MEKLFESRYIVNKKLLITTLSGLLNSVDIKKWKESLEEAAAQIPDNTEFKMLVDLYGFKAENFPVHQEYRTIIPLFLADYGYRIGYLDMFPEASVSLINTRGISCIAMANVHQDESKMKDYETKFSKKNERYFISSEEALQWIENL